MERRTLYVDFKIYFFPRENTKTSGILITTVLLFMLSHSSRMNYLKKMFFGVDHKGKIVFLLIYETGNSIWLKYEKKVISLEITEKYH